MIIYEVFGCIKGILLQCDIHVISVGKHPCTQASNEMKAVH